MEKILLLGNGINRAFDLDSWDNIINSVSENIWGAKLDFERSMPYSFRTTLATKGDHKKLQELIIKGRCKTIPSIIDNPFSSLSKHDTDSIERMYTDLLCCGFDHILTTNYSYEFEACCHEGLADKKYIKDKRTFVFDEQRFDTSADFSFAKDSEIKIPKRETNYRLYTFNKISLNKSGKEYINKIWHIHGEYHNPQTIIMNNAQYTNLITNISKAKNRTLQLKGVFKESPEEVNNYYSWVDKFLEAEVFILGFGYSYSEIDLWWLLNQKFKKNGDNFKVHFYQKISEPKENLSQDKYDNNQENNPKKQNGVDLLRAYSTNIVAIPAHRYKTFYKKAIIDIKDKMKD